MNIREFVSFMCDKCFISFPIKVLLFQCMYTKICIIFGLE
jgi:hypothetical protein